jgi:signal transduction histidine kinase
MRNRPLHKVHRSVFRKLFFILLGTAFLIFLVVATSMRLLWEPDGGMRQAIANNAVQYTDYLIRDLGPHPDAARLESLARTLGIGIRMESPEGTISSSPQIPAIASLPAKPEGLLGDARLHGGHERRQFFLVREQGPRRYAFFFQHDPTVPRPGLVLRLLGIIGVILILCLFALRILLRPLREILRGLNQVSQGNLDYELRGRTKRDEFGVLAEMFNQMTTSIREMVRAKDQLLLDVSHELRSPLTRIKVALEFVNDAEVRQKIDQDVREIDLMLGELLESERLSHSNGRLQLESVSLHALLVEALATWEGQAPGLQLTSGPEADVTLPLDARRARMALKNVIENALKYSATQSRPVELSLQPGAVIRVRDFGQGIPLDDQALLFEPFYRVDKSRAKETGGYGLGLSLCRKILRAHGGDVTLESAPGAGTTVELRFQ